MTQKQTAESCHKLFVYDRSKITVTGVKNVADFDEGVLTSELCDSRTMTIEGKGLNLVVLDLEKSCIEIECTDIFGIYYSDGVKPKGNFFTRLVKS